MAITLYNSMLFIHVLSVIIWFWTIPVFMIIDRVLPNTTEEKTFTTIKMARINAKFSLVAIIGIFLTGSMMTELGDWGWFPFASHGWLAVKQVIFFVLAIGGTYVLRQSEKEIVLAIDANEPMDVVYPLFKKLVMRSHMISGFVLLNVFLATTKLF